MGGQVFAAAAPERIERLVADLHLASQHSKHLVVRELVMPFLLGPLNSRQHHAERIAAHGVL